MIPLISNTLNNHLLKKLKKVEKKLAQSDTTYRNMLYLCIGFEKAIDCFTNLTKEKNEKVSIHVRSCSSYFFRFLRKRYQAG